LTGRTTRRGKKSTARQQALSAKDICLYPLCRDFKSSVRA
jgi:hypothetical protein